MEVVFHYYFNGEHDFFKHKTTMFILLHVSGLNALKIHDKHLRKYKRAKTDPACRLYMPYDVAS